MDSQHTQEGRSDQQARVASEQTAHEQEPTMINGDVEARIRARTEEKVSYMSLPKKSQLTILCIARLADPLAATSIQTYMFYQLKFFDPSASDAMISTQAGIIVGAKTAAQVCTGMLWGRLADSEFGGRRVVLLVGLLSSGISYVGYGFSTTFVSAVAWQVFGGAMSSNVGITRCVVAELNPEKRYRTRALLLLPVFASAGMLIGPLVGGLLSSKTGSGVLKAYPYAPPNLFAAIIYAFAAIGVFSGLEETLEGLHREESFARRLWRKIVQLTSRISPEDHAYAPISSVESDSDMIDSPISPVVGLSSPIRSTPPLPSLNQTPKRRAKLPFSRIWTFNVICTMLAHFIIAGHLGTFNNLWAIFLSTPVAEPDTQHPPLRFSGGVGMQPREVGFAMSALGAIGVVLQVLIYPMLNDRFGTIRIWRSALFFFPIVYVLAPFLSLVASAESLEGKQAPVWVAMGFILLLFVIGRTGVTPATTLLINDCTPHPSVRGTVHTAGTVIGNLSRSLFPVIAFAIFGRGLATGVVGLAFWCLAGLAVLACVASHWVKEGSNGQEIVLENEEADTNSSGRPGNLK